MNRAIFNKLPVFVLIIILFAGNSIIFSQFLVDKEEPGEVIEIVEDKGKTPQFPPHIAFNIRAEKVPLIKDTIKITWDMNPDYTDTYIVGRAKNIIDTKERALSSKSINSVSSKDRGVVIDSGLPPGKYYYVVLARDRIVNRDIELYRDVNFTSFPVEIKESEKISLPDQVSGILIRKVGKKGILVTWKKPEKGGISYSVYRSHSIIDTPEKLQKAEIRTVVENRDNFLDEIVVRDRTYYYAVTVRDASGSENKNLILGQNYTASGLFFPGERTGLGENPYRLKMISAEIRTSGVLLQWDYAGTTGGRFFRVLRSKKKPDILNNVRPENVIAEVDIEKKRFFDAHPPQGMFYYGLVPYLNNDNRKLRLRKGVSVVLVQKTKKRYNNDSDHKTDKYIEEKPFPGKGHSDDIDRILKKTFLKGFYGLALKELQQYIESTDNEHKKAKARYFIGRTYIEQKKYAESLKYLQAEDVKHYFPEESKFWSEFSILHLK